MASNNPQFHHGIPLSLLTLHQKANGTELDGEGIQAWLEWEMEALRWGVPIEISREELEALVSPRASSKPPKTISKGEERA